MSNSPCFCSALQWEETENKGTIATYVAGGAALVWLSGTIVGAVNSVPVLPKVRRGPAVVQARPGL